MPKKDKSASGSENVAKHNAGYERAMRRALEREPFLHSEASPLTREEAHKRVSVNKVVERLVEFGKRRELSLGPFKIKDLIGEGPR